jgi:Spy/CpxP family protein refolding chaperone
MSPRDEAETAEAGQEGTIPMSSIVTKTALRSLLVLSLAAGAAAPAFAQPPAHQARGERPSPEAMIEHRLEMLTTRLSLDVDQQAAVRQILEEAKREFERLRASNLERGPEMHQAFGRIHREVEDGIWGVLTCEQKDAYHALQSERMAHRGRGHHHGHHGRGHHGPRPSEG